MDLESVSSASVGVLCMYADSNVSVEKMRPRTALWSITNNIPVECLIFEYVRKHAKKHSDGISLFPQFSILTFQRIRKNTTPVRAQCASVTNVFEVSRV